MESARIKKAISPIGAKNESWHTVIIVAAIKVQAIAVMNAPANAMGQVFFRLGILSLLCVTQIIPENRANAKNRGHIQPSSIMLLKPLGPHDRRACEPGSTRIRVLDKCPKESKTIEIARN
jgi:hypothetical protein